MLDFSVPLQAFYEILWYFLLYAFLGWCCEVIFCTVNTGKLVNRGFLYGPLCPIYGFGGLLFVLLLGRAESLVLIYLGSVVLASALELVAGFLLKQLFKISWWDYSDEPFNVRGYICLKFSLLWGVAGLVLLRVVQPLLTAFVGFIPSGLGWVLLAVLYAVLLADLLATLASIRNLSRDLGELTRLAQGIQKGSNALSSGLGSAALKVSDKIEQLDLPAQRQRAEDKWKQSRQRADAGLEQGREKLAETLAEGRARLGSTWENTALFRRLEEMARQPRRGSRHLLRAFPGMKSGRYAEALAHLRESLGLKEEKPGQSENPGQAPGNQAGPGPDDARPDAD